MKYLILILAAILFLSVAQQLDYTPFVNTLKQKIQQKPFKGASYQRLAFITDTYGPRLWGSQQLELVIKEMYNMAVKEGFQNVRLQPVSNFTKWVRGKEELTLYSPRPFPTKLDMIGLGGSVPGDVSAQVIVIRNFAQLEANKDKIPGKIVCYNQQWIDYHHSVQYRVDGASKAAKYGAVGVLVRSIASFSISSVHTGYMQYDPAYPKIPCAAITVQDAQMFKRMQDRKQTIKVRFLLVNQFVPNSNSYNLVFEIKGQTFPQQIVVAGGHIDSWDTGSQTGANDDGGGFISVFEAFRLIKQNNFRPKRTMRFVAWSGEESGSQIDGAAQYVTRHKDQLKNHVAAFESDLGSTKLIGFGHSGDGADIVKEVLSKYLSIVDADKYQPDGQSADVAALLDYGVPIFKNLIKDTPDHFFYFQYHHTAGDSMTMMNADELDSNVLGIASFLYIIADLNKTVRQVNNIVIH